MFARPAVVALPRRSDPVDRLRMALRRFMTSQPSLFFTPPINH
jgi:hypothetical protein